MDSEGSPYFSMRTVFGRTQNTESPMSATAKFSMRTIDILSSFIALSRTEATKTNIFPTRDSSIAILNQLDTKYLVTSSGVEKFAGILVRSTERVFTIQHLSTNN